MKKQLILLSLLFSNYIYAAPSSCLITENSIGKIQLGQTLAQVKKTYPNIKISFERDAEGAEYAILPIAPRTVVLAHLVEDSQSVAKIDWLETQSMTCKTADGIYPRMPLNQVPKRLGSLKRIVMSEIEMRQFAEFSRQPKWLTIRVEGGDFGSHKTLNLPITTRKLTPNAYILSLGIAQ